MRNSSDRVLTSHAGGLPRPDDLIRLNSARPSGGSVPEEAFQARLRETVGDLVRRQREIGIDVPGDGSGAEFLG